MVALAETEARKIRRGVVCEKKRLLNLVPVVKGVVREVLPMADEERQSAWTATILWGLSNSGEEASVELGKILQSALQFSSVRNFKEKRDRALDEPNAEITWQVLHERVELKLQNMNALQTLVEMVKMGHTLREIRSHLGVKDRNQFAQMVGVAKRNGLI